MSWRTAVILVLLAGALLTGWHAWKTREIADEAAPAQARSDFILRDFEIIALNGEGQESFALRAPEMQQTPGARTMELATPLFLMPVLPSGHWEVRSKTGWVNENSDLLKLRGNLIQQGSALRDDAREIAPHARRSLASISSPAAHGPVRHTKVAGQIGLPARPVEGLADGAD